MSEPLWVPLDALIDLHREQIAEHGGSPGLRDRTLLEAALARPQQYLAYGSEADLFMLAAVLGVGISRNHPFVDGNKRTAFIAVGIFLELNGQYLDAREDEAYATMMAAASNQLGEEGFAVWLKANCVPA